MKANDNEFGKASAEEKNHGEQENGQGRPYPRGTHQGPISKTLICMTTGKLLRHGSVGPPLRDSDPAGPGLQNSHL